ncbi:hypothetical protein [uncultured Caulobacter sp.]|uniref:hypothetical protein n=1 Tax=uncultured Caulobacter sp. TaxID=158749 RepID=UPI00262DEA82|nr:hypothetical protein [uncultured Caulobacter sp.]
MSLPQAQPDARVLVIDQDAAVRQALSFSLAMDGYRVETFAATPELSSRLRDDGAEAVIVGHAAPAIRAPLVFDLVRDLAPAAVMVVTATHPSAELRRGAEAAGAWLIEKPLLDDTLRDTLRTALGR